MNWGATPVVFGHRGYAARAPENTLAGFRLAAEHKVPGIELDIHLTADKHLVVLHDHNLFRTTGLDAGVEQTRYDEMRELDAGSWFDPAFSSERLPLLEDILAEFGSSFVYDIEIKQEGRAATGIEEQLLGVIRRFGLEANCFVSSFNPFPLRRFRKMAPDIPVAAIYSSHDDVPPILRCGLGAYMSGFPQLVKPHHVKINRLWAWYHIGLRRRIVLPWTVNDAETALRMAACGVAGIITDDPGMVLELLSASAAESLGN
ncbi:MAG: glycerophosphodiester phosphodiesterase [Spirochaetaceae bacterium]|nr:MAG: glycerophosphodiester phosphodiesterase [Spirochaetaceae bacterium]